jgi:hypothetical protein
MRYFLIAICLCMTGCEATVGVYLRKDFYIEGLKTPDSHGEFRMDLKRTF